MRYILLILVTFFFTETYSQQHRRIFQLTGIVKDTSGIPLEKASVNIEPGNLNMLTDSSGFFKFSLIEGFYSLKVNYLSTAEYTRTIRIHKDTDWEVIMDNKAISLDELVVKTKTLVDVNSVSIGKTTVDIQIIKKQPPLMGEIDIIRSVTSLPGVVNAGEGSAGFYVRGGGSDQNLVLFDEAPIFNTSHLFGFFSVFNADVLKGYSLYRSGISAKYGGRISSILEVEGKEGNNEKIKFTGGISPMSLKLGIDGPLGKKTNFILNGRGAIPTYLLKLFKNDNIKRSKAYFYDINFKLNHKINNNNNLHLSSYLSDDGFKFPFDTTYQYQNQLGTLKWSHIFNKNLSSNASFIVSKYLNSVNGVASEELFSLNTSILNQQLKVDFLQTVKKNTIEYGIGIGNFVINPGSLEIQSSESSYNPVSLDKDLGREEWLYINDEYIKNEKLSFSFGLRANSFQKIGPSEALIYDPLKARKQSNVLEIRTFDKGEIEKSYFGLEPRFAIKYSLTSLKSIKLSYNRTRQNLNLISNTSALTPADVWRLANENIKPQIADQISTGYFYIPKNKAFELSFESYFKNMYNQIDYKDGAELILNKYLESDLLNGKGISYGFESFIKKNSGDWTGWLSFSLSKTLRKIKGSTPEETVNNGKWYPSNYDKPLNVNLFTVYQFPYSPWSFSSNFIFSSGRPVTAADSWFIFYHNGTYSNYYGRNQERMPPQIRADISFLRQSPPEKKTKTEWGISIYNLTFRKNAFSTMFKHYYGSAPQAYKLSIIGIAIPSLNFSIKI